MSRVAKYYPYVTSIIVIVVIFKLDKNLIHQIKFKELLESTMVVFSVLFGFLLTVSTLLYTIDTKIMRDLRKTEGYTALLHYLKTAIYVSLSISIISLWIPLLRNTSIIRINPNIIVFIKYAFLFLIFLGLTLSIRFIHVFINTVE